MGIGSRLTSKLQQSRAFVRHSRTPIPLILDSFKLKRSRFTAESREGLRLELHPNSGESFTFYENLVRHDYLQHGIELCAGDCVIDAGANIGAFTVLAARLVGPSGRVISLEPASATFARLESNVRLNGLDNVEPMQVAVGAVPGEMRLYHSDRSAYASLYEQCDGHESGEFETVRVHTLASIMESLASRPVSLLKLDCEGAEYEILESLDVATARNIRQIAMEVHSIPGRDRASIPRTLERLGFTTRATSPLVAFRPWS